MPGKCLALLIFTHCSHSKWLVITVAETQPQFSVNHMVYKPTFFCF